MPVDADQRVFDGDCQQPTSSPRVLARQHALTILTLTTAPIYPSGPHVSHPDSSEWGARPEQPTDRPTDSREPLSHFEEGGCRVINHPTPVRLET